MIEDILREHGANGTTLLVCVVAAWRMAQQCLAAYRDRTTAVREAVDAVSDLTKKVHAVDIIVGDRSKKLREVNTG